MKTWLLVFICLASISCNRLQQNFQATKRLCGVDADTQQFTYLRLPKNAADAIPQAFADISPHTRPLRITSKGCVEIPQDLPPTTIVMGFLTGSENRAFYFRLSDAPDKIIPLMDSSNWTFESDCRSITTLTGRTNQTQLQYKATVPHLEEASQISATLVDANRQSITTEAHWFSDDRLLDIQFASVKAGSYTLKIAIKSYLLSKTVEQECSVLLDGKAPTLGLNIDHGLGLMHSDDGSDLDSFEPGFALKLNSDEKLVKVEYCLSPAAGGEKHCQTTDGATPFSIPESGVWILDIKAHDAAGWVSTRQLQFISYEKTKLELLEAHIKSAIDRFDKGEQLAALTDLLQFERNRRAFTTERERQVVLPRIKEALMHMAVAVNLRRTWPMASKNTRCKLLPASPEHVICVENRYNHRTLVLRDRAAGQELWHYPLQDINHNYFEIIVPRSARAVLIRDLDNKTLTRYVWDNNTVSSEKTNIDRATMIAVSDDGRFASTVFADQSLRLWNWTDATNPKLIPIADVAGIVDPQIRIGPNADLIFVTPSFKQNQGLVFVKTANGYQRQTFPYWYDLQFSVEHNLVLARTQWSVGLYHLTDLSRVDEVNYYTDRYSNVYYANWSPDGKSIQVLRDYGAGYLLLTFPPNALRGFREQTLPKNNGDPQPSHLDLKVSVSPDSQKVALISTTGLTLWKLSDGNFIEPVTLVKADEKILSDNYEGDFARDSASFFYKSYDQFLDFSLTRGMLPSIRGISLKVVPSQQEGRYHLSTNYGLTIYDADNDQLITKDYPENLGSMPAVTFPDERLLLTSQREIGTPALWFDGKIVLESDPIGPQFEISKDGRWAAVIITHGNKTEVELWDITHRKVLGRFTGRFCYLSDEGLLLKNSSQGTIRVNLATLETERSSSPACGFTDGETPFKWNDQTSYVGAGRDIRDFWTNQTLVPGSATDTEQDRDYLQREYDGKRFIDLFADKGGDVWLHADKEIIPLRLNTAGFNLYPDFILAGNPYSDTSKVTSDLIEWQGFRRITVPGKMTDGKIFGPKKGLAVLPMYFEQEDLTRFIPYDLDILLQKSCDYLRTVGTKTDDLICKAKN